MLPEFSAMPIASRMSSLGLRRTFSPGRIGAEHRFRTVADSKPLIVSWLAKNPAFEARVTTLREFVKGRADVSEADVDRLVARLRKLGRA
jgi:hypothetical protein